MMHQDKLNNLGEVLSLERACRAEATRRRVDALIKLVNNNPLNQFESPQWRLIQTKMLN